MRLATSKGIGTSNRVVVFLGALGTHRQMWVPQLLGVTTSGVSAIAVDLRGQGESPVPEGPYSVHLMAQDVLESLDTLGVGDLDVVGLSLGGAVAQEIALQASSRVRTLTLISTSSRFGDQATWTERAAKVRAQGLEPLVDALPGRWLTDETCAKRPHVLDEVRQMFLDTPVEGYASSCEALARWDRTAELSDIEAPTLVVTGAQDPSTTPQSMEAMVARIPKAEHVLIEGSAHLVNVEKPQQLTNAILRHLRVADSASERRQ